jgi:predicted acetyltransferase
MRLVWPAAEFLDSYVEALERGWSPENVRGEVAAREALDRIRGNAVRYLASLVDREASGEPIVLPDGSRVPRLPGYRKWMWDGEFCGHISFRWQRGTPLLPPHCLGHIGYSVVPWKQRRGYATQALRDIIEDARSEGLSCVEVSTDPDNIPSQRVIELNGGMLVERFVAPASLGSTPKLRYRIPLL